MKKLLLILLLLISGMAFSQTNATFKNLDVRNRTTLRGYNYLYDSTFFLPDGSNIPYWDASDTLGYVLSVSNPNESQLVKVRLTTLLDSLNITGGADSLYIAYGCFDNLDTWLYNSDTIYIDTCQLWYLDADTIINQSDYKVRMTDEVYIYPLPPEAAKTGRIMHINQYGQVEWMSPATLVDTLSILMPQYWTFVDAATDTLKNNVSTAGVVAIKGNLELQTTNAAATEGVVKQNGVNLIHTYHEKGDNNLFIGQGAGNFTADSSFNIGIGKATLDAVTTGDKNIGIGINALTNVTTSYQNVAIGVDALSTISAAPTYGNTGVGYGSLKALTTGLSNTALGATALYTETTASYNVAIGTSALYLSNGGEENVAVGHTSLYNNTAGDYSVSIGEGALYNNKANRANTAVGYKAMYNADSRTSAARVTYNTAIGYEAMKGSVTPINNTGQYNTATGYQALDAMTSGSFNTIYGYNAGGGITTGDSNILIGTSAGAQLTTESDQLYIDNTNTTTPLIQGNFRTDELTVNGDLFLNPIPDEATKVGRIAHINQFGKIEWVSPSNVGDKIDSARAASPTAYTMWIRDTVNGFLTPAFNTDYLKLNSVKVLQVPNQTNYVGTVYYGDGGDSLNNTGTNAGDFNYYSGIGAGFNNEMATINTGVGYQALHSTESGWANTAVGYRSLATGVGTGNLNISGNGVEFYANTAVGSRAMEATTTGSYNTAVGVNALLSNTTGIDNTAVGVHALDHNTTGKNNVAIGRNALYATLTKDNSIAIGLSALQSDTSGTNLAIGAQSLAYNTSGTGNIGIGYYSLYANVGGYGDVAIGYESQKYNSSGVNNTSLGYRAGHSNVSNSDNTTIGYEAGLYNTAKRNTYIGSSSGKGVSTLSTEDMNTAVGGNSMYYIRNGYNNCAFGFDALTGTSGAGITGIGNVAMGWRSLYGTTSGNYNTAVGYSSGYTNSTGSNNLEFGYRAGYNETGSYKSYWAADSTSWAVGMGSGSKLLWYADQSNAAKSNHFMNIFAKVAIGEAKDPTVMLEVAGNTALLGEVTSDNSFGELFEDAANVTATVATYKTIVSLQAGQYNEATLTDSSMTITQAGTYLVNYSSSFTHSVNNTVCHISLFVNDAEDTSLEVERKIGTAGDYGSMSGTALVTLTANAVLKLKATSDNDGDLTIHHLNFNCTRIK